MICVRLHQSIWSFYEEDGEMIIPLSKYKCDQVDDVDYYGHFSTEFYG